MEFMGILVFAVIGGLIGLLFREDPEEKRQQEPHSHGSVWHTHPRPRYEEGSHFHPFGPQNHEYEVVPRKSVEQPYVPTGERFHLFRNYRKHDYREHEEH